MSTKYTEAFKIQAVEKLLNKSSGTTLHRLKLVAWSYGKAKYQIDSL